MPAAVDENHARLALSLGYAPGTLYELDQVHGTRCVVATARMPDVAERADAAVGLPGRGPIAVRTADCVPILLADARRGLCAAVHAGWRGAALGVLPAALAELMRERPEEGLGLPAGRLLDVLVALGPHIRLRAFEVGEEVAEQVQAAAPETSLVDRRGPRPHADLTGLIHAQLRRLGVSDGAVEDVGGCTFSEPKRFFSHRRDQGRTGRHLAVISPRAST